MIAIGCDHGGFGLKKEIIAHLTRKGLPFTDVGTDSSESADYPDFAAKAAREVLSGRCEKAILICGTGIGISIAANKISGIRCALCCDPYMARMSREHNDANVLALGGRVTGPGLALEIVDVWLFTEFTGEEKHSRRLNKICSLERSGNC